MGGFALTGVAMGAVVGVGVDGFGENEEGEVPKGGGAKGVGEGVGVRANFSDYAFFQGGSQALFQSVKVRWYQVRRLVSTRLCLRYSLLGRSTVRGILSSLRSLGRQLALSNLRSLTN